MTNHLPASIDETEKLLASADYVATRALATVLFLSLRLARPLFLEGEAGVGKTEIAKVLAQRLNRPLIRLQCYEGLDIANAVYEWNYARQMIEIRLAETVGPTGRQRGGQAEGMSDQARLADTLYSTDFLIERPILQAMRSTNGCAPVLLIDELDRADEAFEAYLLEVLADNQVTIPEIGTIRAEVAPIVIITSNRTREIHDALKRRCLYHWVAYPDMASEFEILRRKIPGAGERLSAEIVAFVQGLRQTGLFKNPGIAETLDWARALGELDQMVLDPENVTDTLGVLLKYQDDIQKIGGSETMRLVEEARRMAHAHFADSPHKGTKAGE